MARLAWSSEARDDLGRIRRYIARDSPHLAANFAQRVIERTRQIVDFPESGRVVPELDSPHIREVLIGSYRVIYLLRSTGPKIILVHHGAQLLGADEVLRRAQ